MRAVACDSSDLRSASVRVVVSFFVDVPPSRRIPSEVRVEGPSQYLAGTAVRIPRAVSRNILSVAFLHLIRSVSGAVEYIAVSIVKCRTCR